MKRCGFTLVELSIVLVIIGLLIGGILAAQSMIGTAKIQNVIRTLGQYDAAYANFVTKYNQIPGDSTLFPTTGGNNDGSYTTYEGMNVWSQLSEGVGLKNKAGNNYAVVDPYIGPIDESNCPRFNIDHNLIEPPCLTVTTWAPVDATYQWWMYGSGLPAIAHSYDPLKVTDAIAIEAKLDDGRARAGRMWGYTNGSSTTPACETAGVYNTNNKGYICQIVIQVGTSTGVNAK